MPASTRDTDRASARMRTPAARQLGESESPILDGAVSRLWGGVQLTVVVTFNIHISLM